MAETIDLYIIGGNECIGDSLPKINANSITIRNSVNELYSLYDTINIGIPAAETLEFYEANFIALSAICAHIFENQQGTLKLIDEGLIAVDFLERPYSTILSSVCFKLSSFNAPITPNPALTDQTLVYDVYTQTWLPSSARLIIAPAITPNGYRISQWNTATNTAAQYTSSNYVSLPGGMIMQFGRLSAAAGAGVAGRSTNREIYVQFPLPFPNDVLNITTNTVVSGINGGVSAQSYIKQGFDKNGFTIVKNLSGNGNIFEMWSAVGF
jgi:hypothetical protein